MERFLDILFSSLALLFLFPFLLIVMIFLRFSGEGEIFFKQKRIGRDGKKFELIKFATMLKKSPSIGTGTVTMKEDPRILPFGKLLRKTKINELPQLLNILIGDMSLIGPRPLTDQAFESYSIDTQKHIVKVKPGLSGIGSIIFHAEEEIMHGDSASLEFYKNVIASYKGDIEKWFVKNKSTYIYFLAIMVTIITIVIPKSSVAWKVFKNLPEPPENLKNILNFPK